MDKVCLFNISPIDGRYNNLTNELSFLFSEFSFIKQRVIIEIHYFLFLLKLNTPEFPSDENVKDFMENLLENINVSHKHLIIGTTRHCPSIRNKQNYIEF